MQYYEWPAPCFGHTELGGINLLLVNEKEKNQRTNRKSAKNVNKVYVNVALKRTNEPEYSVTPCTLPCILAMDKNRERKKAFASK